MPEVAVNVEVYCARCNTGPCNQTESTTTRYRGGVCFGVAPCDTCLEAAREEGYDKGYEAAEAARAMLQAIRSTPQNGRHDGLGNPVIAPALEAREEIEATASESERLYQHLLRRARALATKLHNVRRAAREYRRTEAYKIFEARAMLRQAYKNFREAEAKGEQREAALRDYLIWPWPSGRYAVRLHYRPADPEAKGPEPGDLYWFERADAAWAAVLADMERVRQSGATKDK